MKYLFLILATFSLSLSLSAQSAFRGKNKRSVNSIERSLNYLASDELLGRDTSSEGIEKTASYLIKELKAAGIQPYFSTYRDTVAKFNDTWNIVGVIPGSDTRLKHEITVLGAHYDHIGILLQ